MTALKEALDTRYGSFDNVGVSERNGGFHVSFGEYGYDVLPDREIRVAPFHDNWDWIPDGTPDTLPELFMRAEVELLSIISTRKRRLQDAEHNIKEVNDHDG